MAEFFLMFVVFGILKVPFSVSSMSIFFPLFLSMPCSDLLCYALPPTYNFNLVLFLYLVFQAKCEAAYFIVVLHHLRSVVIAIRGTETAEDLITDGLCKECALSADDLDGLMKYLSVSLFLYVLLCICMGEWMMNHCLGDP